MSDFISSNRTENRSKAEHSEMPNEKNSIVEKSYVKPYLKKNQSVQGLNQSGYQISGKI